MEKVIGNSFSDISITLDKDFITSHSLTQSPKNIEGGLSYLEHTIIFEDFMRYQIYDVLKIL